MRFEETAEESSNRIAADIDECPTCGSEDFETIYKEDFDKNICRECGFEWID